MYSTVLGVHIELATYHVNKHEEKMAKRELRNNTSERQSAEQTLSP